MAASGAVLRVPNTLHRGGRRSSSSNNKSSTPLRVGGLRGSESRKAVVAGSIPGGATHFLGTGPISRRHRRDPAYAAVVKQRYRRLLRPPPPHAAGEVDMAGLATLRQNTERIFCAKTPNTDDASVVHVTTNLTPPGSECNPQAY